MAIPATPTNFYTTTANRQIFLQWDLIAGATGYNIQRSIDGVSYSTLSTPTNSNYLDTAVTVGSQYWYKVASVNGSGTSPYTSPQTAVPTPTSEMSLGQLRYAAQQRADRVNSNFVTLPEWNFYINQAMLELYDLLVTAYEDYFKAPAVSFRTNGSQYIYPLPDGLIQFYDNNNNLVTAAPFFKLLGLDLSINTTQNGWVTLNKYNFIDRNDFVYPNSGSTQYGVFNMRYRPMGNNIELIPTPSANQTIRIQYIPRLPLLLQDTDITTIGYSGWLQYVIIRAAKYALDKEESDTSKLDEELLFLKGRIEEASQNRDAGQPDTISDIRKTKWGGSWGHGNTFGSSGGW